jgi:N-acetyl sugar amidotransferase
VERFNVNAKIQYCSKCVLNSNYPAISFDDQGVCNYCRRWELKWPTIDYLKQGVVIDVLLSRFRKKSKPYDCVLGLSGGKDSCYAAYVLKKLGMNPLAVTFENQFMTGLAYANIESTIEALNLAHVVVKFDPAFMKNLYRNIFLRAGEFCSACNVGIRASIYRIAKAYDINLIVTGQSTRTEAASPPEFSSCRSGYFSNVTRDFLDRESTKGYMYFGQIKRIVWHLLKKPYYIQLPNYICWDEKVFIDTIKRELGWRGIFGEQHTDCKMSHAKELINLYKYNITELAAKVSIMVCDGQLSRETALVLVEKQQKMLLEESEQIQSTMKRELSLSDMELKKTLGISHLKYLDWSDDLFSLLKDLHEKVFFKKGS